MNKIQNQRIHEILKEADRRGVCVKPDGPKLTATLLPGLKLDRDFRAVLLRHKPAILKVLYAQRHLERQVICGEYDGAEHVRRGEVLSDLYSHHDRTHPMNIAAISRLARPHFAFALAVKRRREQAKKQRKRKEKKS